MDLRAGARAVVHRDLPEVVLAELARGPLEAHHRHRRGRGPQPPHQRVQRALAAPIARLARPTQEFDAQQGAILRQPRLQLHGPRGRQRGAPDAPGAAQVLGVTGGNPRLVFDPAHASDGDARLRRHHRLGHAYCTQNLDLMPAHGWDHSSPFPRRRCPAAAREKSVTSEPSQTGQNSWKEGGQNSRNSQGQQAVEQ
jgi:hypothetical protein